jgi:hypothetical protein
MDKAAAIEKITQQILAQGMTSKWKGEGKGSAEANARDMARIIADTGATDINQFGKITKTGVDVAVQPVFEAVLSGSGDSQEYVNQIVGYTDAQGNRVDPKLVKTETDYGGESGNMTTTYTAPIGTQEVFGNKLTGQEVANTYSERQTGNAFGGTFAGKGNTGYRVEFAPNGTPLFYTTGASSSDVPSWVVPALVLGGAYFGLDASGLLSGTAGGSLTAGITVADIAAAEAALAGATTAGGLLTAGSLTAGITPAQIAAAEAALPTSGLLSGSLTAGITPTQIAAGEAALPSAGGSLTAGITTADIAASEAGLPSAGSLTAGITTADIAASEAGLPAAVGSLTAGITPTNIAASEAGLPSASVSTNVGNILSNLTPNQIANIVGGFGGLLGGAALTSGGGTGGTGGVGALPTQGVPLNTADYYTAIQQNYNRLLPAVPRDVATPLAQWYNSQYGA